MLSDALSRLALATTPWIAFVSCDSNTTNSSMENDIFTLARDRGAVAAVRLTECLSHYRVLT